jgi:4-hydroxythreonine-4-phosphate dehydrogenase
MMLAGPRLRVVPVTIHLALREAIGQLSAAAIVHAARVTHAALIRDFGVAAPVVAVAGLNPHAGEDGLLGSEDRDVIAPALEPLPPARLSGPLVPDAAFRDLIDGRHDALVAMYHDQGLIPVKLIDFERAVNVTLGLPIVRTSPDHGTAYDIAGSGRARALSMQSALALAVELAERRARRA